MPEMSVVTPAAAMPADRLFLGATEVRMTAQASPTWTPAIASYSLTNCMADE